MMYFAKAAVSRHWPVAVLLGLVCLAGCRPGLQSSDQAEPWPLLDRDPAEDGVDLDRWPSWRGHNGSGIAAGGSPVVEFGDGRNTLWKVPVPGRGHSSPVVWGDNVLLTSATDDTDPPTVSVFCFHRGDGSLLWQAPAGQAQGRTHKKHGHASASVSADGRRIFAFFGSTGLFCYDFSGQQLWRADLGNLEHVWGTASSPVLWGNMVIQLCDSAEDSHLSAFDVETGEQIWRTPRASDGSWSTPVFIDVGAGDDRHTEMVINGGSGAENRLVIAYDPSDGRELWRVGETTRYVTPLPVTCNGLIFCASGRNGPIQAIQPGGSGDVTASHVVWQSHRGGPYVPSPIAYRNRLFIIGDGGKLACYNAGSGKKIWDAKLSGPFTSSLVAADGRIYAVSEQGTVYVFAAADRFELLATNELGARCLASLAIADGELFLRTETDLYCFADASNSRPAARPMPRPLEDNSPPDDDAAGTDAWPLFRGDPGGTGVAATALPERPDLLWTFTVDDGGFLSTAVIDGGIVYAGCLDGKLYAADLASGEKRWDFETELGFTAAPAVRDRRVFVGDSDGRFYWLDAETGEQIWDFSTDAEINSSANFHNESVVFGSQDGFLYCLNRASGEVVWRYESEDMIQCSPTVSADRTFVAGCDARLTVVDLIEGEQVTGVDIEAPTLCTPAVAGQMAYVGTTGGTFFAIDWQKAEVVWRYENPERSSPFHGSAAITPRAVIVGSQDKHVHAIDRAGGRGLWTFATKGHVDSSPVVVGRAVFVGSADGRIYSLDLKTGLQRWVFDAGGSILASPAVAAGRLVIGTDEGDLYCFGKKE